MTELSSVEEQAVAKRLQFTDSKVVLWLSVLVSAFALALPSMLDERARESESLPPDFVAALSARAIPIGERLSGRQFGADGFLTHAFTIASVSVRPRAFGLFNIKSANELHVVEGEFDIHLRDGVVSEDLPIIGGGESGLKRRNARGQLRGYGFVTRVVIDRLVLRFHDAGVEVLEVAAVRGVSNDRDGLALVDAVLALPDDSRSITTALAHWTPDETSFVLPKSFQIDVGGDVVTGRSATVDLQLEVQ